MEREIAPLVRDWARRKSPDGRLVCERNNVRLTCSGMGAEHAANAARWLVSDFQPELLISAGFSGGLKPQCRAGELLVCGTVIDERSGETFACACGDAVLVSCSGVLSGDEKRRLAERHGADGIDMEAVAVARVAREKGTAFAAVKAISDEVDFEMPPMNRFIDAEGGFDTAKLLAYAAVRPSVWPVLARLEKNTKLASERLCAWLESQMKEEFHQMLVGART
jgi:adenosylhomocysteine nucleosidase